MLVYLVKVKLVNFIRTNCPLLTPHMQNLPTMIQSMDKMSNKKPFKWKNRQANLKEVTLSYSEQKSVFKSGQRVQSSCSLKLTKIVRSCFCFHFRSITFEMSLNQIFQISFLHLYSYGLDKLFLTLNLNVCTIKHFNHDDIITT